MKENLQLKSPESLAIWRPLLFGVIWGWPVG